MMIVVFKHMCFSTHCKTPNIKFAFYKASQYYAIMMKSIKQWTTIYAVTENQLQHLDGKQKDKDAL